MSLRGMTVKGLQIKGADFLTPPEVGVLNAWWQWKTGITLNAGNVSQWDDQSGNGYHFLQGTASRQPPYNAGTGLITPDGSADYMRATLTLNEVYPEFTVVVDLTGITPAGVIFSKANNTAADADALNLFLTSIFKMAKSSAVGAGATIRASTVVTQQKYILSFGKDFYINGSEVNYETKSPVSWAGLSPMYLNLFGTAANSGGTPTTPSAFGNVPVLEACYHQNTLTMGQRSKLTNYFRNKHQILT